eukprot:5567778-Amphidinium_carterae.2
MTLVCRATVYILQRAVITGPFFVHLGPQRRGVVDHPAWQACFESHVVDLLASARSWQNKWSLVEIAAQKAADELCSITPYPVCSPRLQYVACIQATRLLRRKGKKALRDFLLQVDSWHISPYGPVCTI